ncbi:unnamed protein product [Taenia asiatica]|uniref:C2H2-type domain-containing protein n=1 Tax=Taenia asiatica TaxID=60517 RepID=A0A0R3VSD2_TAEAS|nr:unnamed protein product [Taenia asiatica]
MANTDDSRRNGNGRSTPPPEESMKQQQQQHHHQQQQQQEGAEADQPEATNTLALCPQCPFASRSPSEVDEHMINVHRAALPSEENQIAESAEQILIPPFSPNEMSPQLSTLLSLARAFPEAGSIAFPGVPVLQTSGAIYSGNPDQSISTEEAQRPIPKPHLEDTPCSSASMMQNIQIRTDSRRRYKCSKCPNSFPWHGDLTDHMKRVHGITKSSRNCSRGGSTASGSTSSECARSSRSAGTYQCPYCKYDAKYLSELRRHKRLHMGVKPFACIFCAYKSAWKGDLKRHMESHHKDKFETDEDLARIMAQFKNNAGTTALDPSEEQVVRPSSATSASSPSSQANRDTSMLLGLPATSHADLSLPTTTAAASQLLINTLLTLPPTTQALDPKFYPSLHSLASLLTPPTNLSQPSSFEVSPSPPHPSPLPPPPQELLLPPPPALPLSSPLSATTPPSAIEGLNTLLNSWNWMYKANRRQGQGRLLRWSTTDVSSEPSTSRQCYASEASRDTTVSPDYNISRPASNGSTHPSECNVKTTSAFRCCVCKMIFPMWKSLAQHIAFHHPGLGEATTLAATATGNIVINTTTGRSNSSSPLDPTSSRVSSKRSLTPPSLNKLSSEEDEQSATRVKACGMQHLAYTETPSVEPIISPSISSTPTSLAESEPINQRPKLRAKRSLVHQFASSATQTQSPLLLSTLDNLISGNATDTIAAVFQLAEILKQAVTFLQSLLGEGTQETIENLNEQLPSVVPDQLLSRLEGDENEPSTLADRSQGLALLLVDPQVQSLTNQLLSLLHRVKQQFNIPGKTDESPQLQQ